MTTDALQLDAIQASYRKITAHLTGRIIICAGTGCVANGALKVHEAFCREIAAAGLALTIELADENSGVHVSRSGCQGFCQMGPLVTMLPQNILYTKVQPRDVAEIVAHTLIAGSVVERLLYENPADGLRCRGTDDIPFYKLQHRYVLKNCGIIDPEDPAEYIAGGGYRGAMKAVLDITPEQLCREMLDACLRGRGGGGFPTGMKWDMARKQPGAKKYIICNGDEGDPGAFMDRSVMEGNPHSVVEGMIIAAHAIGADEGYVYVRAEYPLAVRRMRKAVADARRLGILGNRIFGSSASCNLHIMEGAGAFVCGEESAMIASIQGSRGMPMPKPPFPVQSGLWGKPTVINNVETLATVPLIITGGAAAFRRMGTKYSPGTKTFAITGHVANTGLIEVPFGTTLREIIFNIAGGVTTDDGILCNEAFKAVQIGGPSGGCLTEKDLDLPLDFDSLKFAGAMVGSGGLVVMNAGTCMVAIARFFMQFAQNESCGKCVLCREGTRQMLDMLDDIIEGRADSTTLGLLKDLGQCVQKGSLCGLGKTAPNPVLSTLAKFPDEYRAHVEQGYCPTGRCKALVKFRILPDLCKGCMQCKKKCPAGAITGVKGAPHEIDPSKCIKCWACIEVCRLNAITGA
jgi:NADH-quinone oxidoreductase subunit F